MKTFLTGFLIVVMCLRFDGPLPAHAQAQTNEVVGRIVRYDAISNAGTANADVIVKLKNGEFVRLLYSPHGYSFDAPPPKSNEILPPEMFSNGKIEWKFAIYLPRDPGQRLHCMSYPQKGVRSSDGSLKLVDPYIPVPGNESVVVPRANSLSCQIISGWVRN